MKKPPPTVVERIDAALHTLNHSASGRDRESAIGRVSVQLATELLHARETAETLLGFLGAEDA
jgi:hypothetical protein